MQKEEWNEKKGIIKQSTMKNDENIEITSWDFIVIIVGVYLKNDLMYLQRTCTSSSDAYGGAVLCCVRLENVVVDIAA